MDIEKLPLKTENLVTENVLKLGEIFPEILTEIEKDGKSIKTINLEKLKELVGDYADKNSEIYELTWAGKQNARRVATESTTNTLRPVIEDSVDFENTENLYIEGDNLEVLKILRKSYSNSIKCIYIDPPYNTGKDFVYKDNFSMSKEDYEAEAGAIDEEGNRLIKNTGTDGRFHSNWLNMMYPRLQLAYKLLKKDGVIFISIDDNEVDNLKKVCNEIFGENNFIAQLVWENKEGGGSSDSKFFRIKHEYILVYTKSIELAELKGEFKKEDSSYAYSDEFVEERGRYKLIKLNSFSIQYSKSLDYEIEMPNGEKVTPSENGKRGCWRWSKTKFEWGIKNNFIEFKENTDGKLWVYTKQYFKLDHNGNPITRSVPHRGVIAKYSSTQATKQMEKIFGKKMFDYSKPYDLIQFLGLLATDKDDTILDFFSGSATTAHAVMQLNAEDNGSRKFIMVQLPEEVEEGTEAFKAGYKNICEIGKERIRRAAKKIQEENSDKDLSNVDFGFRVFKLDESNMKDTYYSPEKITQTTLINFKDTIKEDRTEEDLIYQVLLNMGIPISAKIEINTIQNKKVFVINSGWLVGCFDQNIDLNLIRELAEIKSEISGLKPKFVFRESSFKNDSEMINTMEYLKTKLFKTDAELKSNVKVI
ncbi:Site-specific DNA-methyltransferase (adenine-specific) [Methanococcus vannielii SB]|uniref:Site-specific DNA-methyltransferase (Adenine-specific) n=1 Tax=Methanococcus vannielii (strain ATCC 35089 / DSM 1224 / JCM 13029 / OCM 148 / SB) TaxID=406327 RepID=A6UNJ3_METVS|nr:site-specific DNA-methyltransferase [Methanococcus vannielii]ABR54065.1 Site-specific DNA-methyltransferase (adenine-specific) [Methanococcus vannielii SB]